MPYTKILFSAVVGAVIGYITNWLAIKMLFRPHEEKRIFGIKIPFTPGLIPKERERIAKSVGDAVGNHLLTKESMLEALKENDVDSRFKLWIDKKVKRGIKKDSFIRDELKNIVGYEFLNVISKFKNKVSISILKTIRKDDFKLKLEDLIVDVIKDEFKKSPREILESKYYKIIKKRILSNSLQFKNSKEFKNYLEKGVQKKLIKLENADGVLSDIMPLNIISSLKLYIYNRNYDISMGLKDILNEDAVKIKLQNICAELISSNLNPMIAMFLNPNNIFNKVHSTLSEQLDKEETQKEVALFVNNIIDKTLNTKVSTIISSLSEDIKIKNSESISDIILNNILEDEVFDEILLKLEDKIKSSKSIEELLIKAKINSSEIIRGVIENKIDVILQSQGIVGKISFYTDKVIDKILDSKICDLTKGKEEEILSVCNNISKNTFDKFINNEALEVLGVFDISKIVEKRINAFEVSFAEKIILDIASKELSAITWLGALLGFIMGLVSSVIAMM